jgi:hypothetical protein
MQTTTDINSLVGQDLSSFKVLVMTEVFKVNDDGIRSISIGYFKDVNIAQAFAGSQTDAPWHKTRDVYVLTDGNVGFLFNTTESVYIPGDEKAMFQIREKALAKLTPTERKILGI